MNKKNNQRTRITKLLIKQAYLDLIKEKQTGKITVKDICEKSEINRSTFYLHFSDPDMVLRELEDETIQTLKESLLSIGALDKDKTNAKKHLIAFLHYIHKHDTIYRTLFVKNTDPNFREKMLGITEEIVLSSFHIPINLEILTIVNQFIVHGCLDLICDWIKKDFYMTESNLCDIIYSICAGCIYGVYNKK